MIRHSFYTGLFLLLCVLVIPAKAQVAGDSCVGVSTSATILGESQTLVCDGTNFKLMVETDSTGRSNLQIDDDTANVCDATKLGRLAYDDGTDTWQYCDGTNWVDLVGASGGGGVVPFFFDFTDLTDQETSSVVSSDAVLISGIASALQVTISGDGTPQFRICDDFSCGTVDHTWGSANQNIDNGQYLQLRLTVPQVELDTSTVIVSVGDAVADWRVTSPEGRTVFITNTTYTGASVGGIDGADAKCQALADAVPLSGTYKAWISDSTTSPSVRFVQDGRPYVLTNGTFVADSWTDLVDGSLDAAINITQTGASNSNRDVWTATNTNGAYSFSSCSDWSSTGGFGTYGESEDTNSQWTNRSSESCGNSNYLYCFEQGAGSGGSSNPPPDYLTTGWELVGTFNATQGSTCTASTCDTGLDIPSGAVEIVLMMAYDFGTDFSWSGSAAKFVTSPQGCVSESASGIGEECIQLSVPGAYGTGTDIIWPLLYTQSSNNTCGMGLKIGDSNIYYYDGSSTTDCAFALYYR